MSYPQKIRVDIPGKDAPVYVFSAATGRFEEDQYDGRLHVVEYLEIIATPGKFDDINNVTWGRVAWEKYGAPENHTGNPWFNPGLERVIFKRVSEV